MIPSEQYRFLRHALRDGRSIKRESSSRWMKLHLDPWLLCFLILNALLGLMVVYSATAGDVSMVLRQAISFGMGFIILFICAQIPPKVYQLLTPYLYTIAVVLLVLVLLIGEKKMGARRWILL